MILTISTALLQKTAMIKVYTVKVDNKIYAQSPRMYLLGMSSSTAPILSHHPEQGKDRSVQ
jgi:hypothetical protein